MGKKLPHKTFLKHIIIILVVTALILFTTFKLIDKYTLHNESITTPDFSGLTINELDQFASERELRYEIIDSVFNSLKQKGSVIAQDPLPGFHVKKGRKIYLTVVSMLPERVKIPNLIDLTLRQSMAILETYGLIIGELSYLPNLAKNAVLKQKYKGERIEAGTMLEKGSVIDLVLGDGLKNEKTIIPFLYGLTLNEAIKLLNENSLNAGMEIFVDVVDSSSARIFKTKPEYSENKMLKLGQSIDLYFASEENYNFEELLSKFATDSIPNDSIQNEISN